VLEAAIAAGGSTLRDHARVSGDLGYFQHSFRVYARERQPCLVCGTPIVRRVQSGRSSFSCPRCQR
jgi:formamidopyrimidine-DNA glycosylase